METNESILTRKVVSLDDRKLIGSVNELRVDCDTLAVSHYIAGSASTNAPLALPFDKAIAVGDTFVTVQSRDDFVPAATAESQDIVRNGYALVGCSAYTRTGNALGTVKSYEFDPVFGTVTTIVMDDGTTFAHEAFVFFSPEFVFVDDGAKTAAELRAADEADGEEAEEEQEATTEPEGAPTILSFTPPLATSPTPTEDLPEPAEDEAPVELEDTIVDEDADVVALLLGSTLIEDVTSQDGAFTAACGTTLTQDVIDEAREHDALLLLVMSIED